MTAVPAKWSYMAFKMTPLTSSFKDSKTIFSKTCEKKGQVNSRHFSTSS